jgi:hypothetical protein
MVLEHQPHAAWSAAGSQVSVVRADDEVDRVRGKQRTSEDDPTGAKAVAALGGPVGRSPFKVPSGRRGCCGLVDNLE